MILRHRLRAALLGAVLVSSLLAPPIYVGAVPLSMPAEPAAGSITSVQPAPFNNVVEFTGACPAKLHFEFQIAGQPANAKFSYWVVHRFNDQATTSPITIVALSGGVADEAFDLSLTDSTDQNRSNDVQLYARAFGGDAPLPPNPVASNKVPFKVTCTVASPTNLRPVQSDADCSATPSSTDCVADIPKGRLQLIWDPVKGADSYKVFRVDGNGHNLLPGSPTAPYYKVDKPSEGYANLCFAIEAVVHGQSSSDSPKHCYQDGDTAATRSFAQSEFAAQVDWNLPAINCGNGNVPPSTFFASISTKFNQGNFTSFFPWFADSVTTLTGSAPDATGISAGKEVVLTSVTATSKALFGNTVFCSTNEPSGQVTREARSGVAFDDLKKLGKHKIYSAALTLESPTGLLTGNGGLFHVTNGTGCGEVSVRAANKDWELSLIGNLSGAAAGEVHADVSGAPKPIDVGKIVSTWASDNWAADYGFVVTSSTKLLPNADGVCFTQFKKAQLDIVYF